MCQLLKIDSILECVGCVTICNVNGYVVIVTVGKVDVIAIIPRCSGTGYFIIVSIIVGFNPVCITQAVLKSALASICVTNTYPTTSSKRI